MNQLRKALKDSTGQPYLIGIFSLGLTSGMVFTIISFTLSFQLAQAKYSTSIIGGMFLTTLPYCFKPLFAPFIDRYTIPILCKKFGQRRGWMLASQISLLVSISGFLIIDHIYNLCLTVVIAFLTCCCAAMHDIILDAYRIERATKEELPIVTSLSGIGFRMGMLISSTGALYLAHYYSWHFVYTCALLIMLIGPITSLCIAEPAIHKLRHNTNNLSFKEYLKTIQDSVEMLKQSHPRWLLIILFIFLYKICDSIPMAMSSPIFIELGFTPIEIAKISKAYGILIMMCGCFIGGILTKKVGTYRSILISGTVQLLSPIMFMFLSMAGHNIPMFITAITTQNFCSGLGGTTLIIYLSSLCNSEYVATQFAIIYSFSSFSRVILSSISGFFVAYFEWPQFFLGSALLSMLCILVFIKLNTTSQRKEPVETLGQ